MNAATRNAIRAALDQAARARLFTTDSYGRTILKNTLGRSPHEGNIVTGITHGSHWSYQHHRCRCNTCVDEERIRVRARRERKKTGV